MGSSVNGSPVGHCYVISAPASAPGQEEEGPGVTAADWRAMCEKLKHDAIRVHWWRSQWLQSQFTKFWKCSRGKRNVLKKSEGSPVHTGRRLQAWFKQWSTAVNGNVHTAQRIFAFKFVSKSAFTSFVNGPKTEGQIFKGAVALLFKFKWKFNSWVIYIVGRPQTASQNYHSSGDLVTNTRTRLFFHAFIPSLSDGPLLGKWRRCFHCLAGHNETLVSLWSWGNGLGTGTGNVAAALTAVVLRLPSWVAPGTGRQLGRHPHQANNSRCFKSPENVLFPGPLHNAIQKKILFCRFDHNKLESWSDLPEDWGNRSFQWKQLTNYRFPDHSAVPVPLQKSWIWLLFSKFRSCLKKLHDLLSLSLSHQEPRSDPNDNCHVWRKQNSQTLRSQERFFWGCLHLTYINQVQDWRQMKAQWEHAEPLSSAGMMTGMMVFPSASKAEGALFCIYLICLVFYMRKHCHVIEPLLWRVIPPLCTC